MESNKNILTGRHGIIFYKKIMITLNSKQIWQIARFAGLVCEEPDPEEAETDFTIADCDGSGRYAPEAFIHTIGEMAGKQLEEIKGLKFTVTVEKNA